jgi:hypothetical protein
MAGMSFMKRPPHADNGNRPARAEQGERTGKGGDRPWRSRKAS